MRARSLYFSFAVLFISLSGLAQKNDLWSHFAWGGIKRNIFTESSRHVGAFLTSPGYNEKDILPNVRNTISFAFGVKSYKPMSKRWTFSNTLGIDMQQLSVETGMKKQFSSATISSYSRDEIHALY